MQGFGMSWFEMQSSSKIFNRRVMVVQQDLHLSSSEQTFKKICFDSDGFVEIL